MPHSYYESLIDIRTAIQQCTLERYPQFTLNAIEPYTRQCCRDLWEQAWKPTPHVRAETKPTVARWPTELRSLCTIVPTIRSHVDTTCHDKKPGDERYRQHITAKGFNSGWQASYLGIAHFFIMGADELRPTALDAIGARVHAGVFLLKDDTQPAAAVFTREHVRQGYRYRRLLWSLAMGLADELTGQPWSSAGTLFTSRATS